MPPEPKRVLIVDDEPGIREVLSEALKLKKYRTVMAVNGQDGLEKAIECLPDLILLDVMMPVMDGWEMLARLHKDERTRDIPVVMLTARGDTEALIRSEHDRAVDYFIKPIDLKELLSFVQRYIH